MGADGADTPPRKSSREKASKVAPLSVKASTKASPGLHADESPLKVQNSPRFWEEPEETPPSKNVHFSGTGGNEADVSKAEAAEGPTQTNAQKVTQFLSHPFLKGLLAYLFFCILFSVITLYHKPDEVGFYMSDRIKRVLLGDEEGGGKVRLVTSIQNVLTVDASQSLAPKFANLADISDVWAWLLSTFMPVLYSSDAPGRVFGTVLGSNYVLGGVRLRQLRVQSGPCPQPPPGLEALAMQCHPPYSPEVEETSTFGPQQQFRWLSSVDLAGNHFSYDGLLSSYSGGGYSVNLPLNRSLADLVLKEMMDNQWLDATSRALFIEFNVYNANVATFLLAQLLVELPAGGGVVTTSSWRTMKLFKYLTGMDFFVAVLEILFVLFLCYYIFDAIVTLREVEARRYFTDPWNVLEWVNLSVFLAVVVLRIMTLATLSSTALTAETFTDLQSLAFVGSQEDSLLAVNAFCTYLKLFRYLGRLPRLDLIFRTMAHASRDLFLFLILFAVVFLGFVAAFHLAFSLDVFAFRTLGESVFTLFQVLLGKFDLAQLQSTNRVLAPLLFLMYVVLCWWLLLSMFLAILADAYTNVKEEMQLELAEAGGEAASMRSFWRQVKARLKEMLIQGLEAASRPPMSEPSSLGGSRPITPAGVAVGMGGAHGGLLAGQHDASAADAFWGGGVAGGTAAVSRGLVGYDAKLAVKLAAASQAQLQAQRDLHHEEMTKTLEALQAQVEDTDKHVLEVSENVQQIRWEVEEIKKVTASLAEHVESFPGLFKTAIPQFNGDVYIRTVSRKLDMLTKALVLEMQFSGGDASQHAAAAGGASVDNDSVLHAIGSLNSIPQPPPPPRSADDDTLY